MRAPSEVRALELSFDRLFAILGVIGILIGAGVAIATAAKAKGEMLFAVGCFVISGLALCFTAGIWLFSRNLSFLVRLSGTVALSSFVCVLTIQANRWAERRYRTEQSPISSLEHRNRLRMLERVRIDWIDGVLMQSLWRIARIELGLEKSANAVAERPTYLFQVPGQRPAPISAGTSIVQLFDEAGGALLILGAPGTGKTTLLLELARDLLKRAESDVAHPIPVVFNLSSWALRRLPLDQWLATELNDSDVPKRVAEWWVESEQVVPLLDGLDEVASEHRQACTTAINDFRREHGLVPIAVCSRIADYEALGTKLRLRSAVVVKPLTRPQVQDYLESAGEQLKQLKTALSRDTSLWEILESPLMLWVAMLAYQDAPVEFSRTDSPRQRRRRIFAKFVEAMLRKRSLAAPCTGAETLSWLSRLASAMKTNQQTVFQLEALSEPWLATGAQRWVSRAGRVLGSGILGALTGTLIGVGFGPWVLKWFPGPLWKAIGGGVVGLIIGSVVGLGSGLIALFMDVRPVEAIRCSLLNISTRVRKATRDGLVVSIIAASLFALVGLLNDRLFSGTLALNLKVAEKGIYRVFVTAGWKTGLSGGLWIGLIMGLITLLSGGILRPRTTPGQGIHRSATIALIAGSTSGFLSGSISWLTIGPGGSFFNSVSVAVVVGLFGGGLFCIKHATLRLILWGKRLAPLRYVRFLNYASDLLFLRRVGGGYIFVHRLLLEYFASLEES